MRQDIVNEKLWPDAPIAPSSDGSCHHLECDHAQVEATHPLVDAPTKEMDISGQLCAEFPVQHSVVAAKQSPPW